MIHRLPIALVSLAIALGLVTGCEQIPGFADHSKHPSSSETPDAAWTSTEPTPRPEYLRYLHDIVAKFDDHLTAKSTPTLNISIEMEPEILIFGTFPFIV
ncbi:hypothetical protein D3C87_1189240 [compost metagenome]